MRPTWTFPLIAGAATGQALGWWIGAAITRNPRPALAVTIAMALFLLILWVGGGDATPRRGHGS